MSGWRAQKNPAHGRAFGFWVAGAGLGASRRLGADRDACVAAPAAEPASSQVQNLHIAKQKSRSRWDRPFCLVAGARYTNYMQIEIEPFPMLA